MEWKRQELKGENSLMTRNKSTHFCHSEPYLVRAYRKTVIKRGPVTKLSLSKTDEANILTPIYDYYVYQHLFHVFKGIMVHRFNTVPNYWH